jgi:hypothetical protein
LINSQRQAEIDHFIIINITFFLLHLACKLVRELLAALGFDELLGFNNFVGY